MNWQLLLIFASAAFIETLHPGPTIALVIDTRIKYGTAKTLSVVAGITAANIVWVAFALFLLKLHDASLHNWSGVLVGFFAIPYLMFLASERILFSTVLLVTDQTQESVESTSSGDSMFRMGFLAHAVNPLSIVYYLATFSLLVAGMPLEHGVLFGLVPIVIDLVVFLFLAFFKTPIDKYFPAWLLNRVLPLLSGSAFVVIVVYISSQPSDVNFYRNYTGLVLLVALLISAIKVARRLVLSQKEKSSKMLWRIVAIWDSWFKVIAVAGAIITLASSFEIDPLINQRIRICFVVAGVLAGALSFAKAFGELQDERSPPKRENVQAIDPNCWQASELWVGVAVFAFLGAVFLLMTLTGFNLQVASSTPTP